MDTQKLRQRILDLAIRGKLVPQDPNDEPASVLLDRIRAEKERLIAEGKIKRPKAKKSTDKPHYQKFTPPFDIPASWQWVRLEDIIEEPKYGTSSKSLSKGRIPVLRMGNITKDGEVEYSNLVYSDNESEMIEYQLKKGDILFNRTNSSEWVGKSALYDGKLEAIYAGYLVRVRPIMILSEYLILVMTSSYYRNWCHLVKTDAVNQSNINAQKLKSFLLPLPPLKEQRRIYDNFLKLSVLRRNISDSCNKLSDMISLTKSKILDLAMQGKLVSQDPADEPAANMLRRINPKAKIITDNPHYPQLPDNWVLIKLGDAVKVINGKSQREVENPLGAYPIYGSGGIIGMADTYTCLSGSTIIGRKGTINNPLFIETNFWNVDTAFGMKPSESVNDLFFYYFCKSFDFTSLDKSSTLPSLTKSALEEILMPIPPLGEQHRIVLKIKEYDRLFQDILTQLKPK